MHDAPHQIFCGVSMQDMKLNRSLRRAGWLASTAVLFAGAQAAFAQDGAGKIEATAPEAHGATLGHRHPPQRPHPAARWWASHVAAH